MRLAIAAMALVVAAGPAGAAAGAIRCTGKNEPPVTISLDSQRTVGRMMSCISGEFISEMTPCAPTGAFSLSAPTGSASIVKVVNRWQDYADHTGGVVGFFQNTETISFTGGFNTPESGLVDDWTFTVDRIAGTAKLTRKGKAAATFTCGKAAPKF